MALTLLALASRWWFLISGPHDIQSANDHAKSATYLQSRVRSDQKRGGEDDTRLRANPFTDENGQGEMR